MNIRFLSVMTALVACTQLSAATSSSSLPLNQPMSTQQTQSSAEQSKQTKQSIQNYNKATQGSSYNTTPISPGTTTPITPITPMPTRPIPSVTPGANSGANQNSQGAADLRNLTQDQIDTTDLFEIPSGSSEVEDQAELQYLKQEEMEYQRTHPQR